MAGRDSTPDGRRDTPRSTEIRYSYGPSARPTPPGRGPSAPGPRPPGSRAPGTTPSPTAGGGAGTVTGSFPAAYARVPEQGPTGYEPRPPARPRRAPAPQPRRLIDYPRWGRSGWTRWIPSWRLVGALIGIGVAVVVAALAYAYAATNLPAPDAQASAQASVIYYADGKTPIATLASQNRQNVQLAQVPVHVRQAVVAAEDRTFYSNAGIDPTSIVRAAWNNVRGNSLQGGSTISQQYVKNVYDERDRTYKRKAKEIFLAIKINRQVSKDAILERYLNTIYLGDGAYGIQAASRAYFNKDVGKLGVSEGAFLAGIINAPSLADPRDGEEQQARALRRWNVVMDAMVAEGHVTAADRGTAKFPKFAKKQQPGVTKYSQHGFLRDMAVAEAMRDLGVTEEDLETGGYRIVTTFDPEMVKAGARAVNEMLPKKRPKGLQVGLASVDPRSGAVRAVYGGGVYKGASLNNATIARAQAGSTFKPFGLMAALQEGLSLKNTFRGPSPMEVDGQKIKNFGGTSFGYIDLVEATEDSVNTVYAQLNKEIGPKKTAQAAFAAGIPKDANVKNNLVNILGSADPHPIDMARAYATFAAGGIKRDLYCIDKITLIGDPKDERWRTSEARTKGKRVFEKDQVADLTYAMQQVVESGSGEYARRLGRPAAGKTGTSSGSKSAWFAGFTPQLSTAVAMWQVGGTPEQPREVSMKGFGEFRSITGGSYPVRIWTEYMQDALRGKEKLDFPEPVYGGEIEHSAPVYTPPSQPTAPPTQGGGPGGPGEQPTNQPPPPPQPSFTPQQPEPSFTPPDPTGGPTPPGDGGGNGDGGNGGNGGGNQNGNDDG